MSEEKNQAQNQPSRQELRDAIFKEASQFKTKEVEVVGNTYLIRQPSVGERNKLSERATDANGNFDPMEFVVWGAIGHVLHPETKEPVFEETDYDLLMGMPAGGAIDRFFEEIMNIFNVETPESEEKK